MAAQKFKAGDQFPKMTVSKLGGGELTLGTPSEGKDWQVVVVYRGKHCPICTNYLSQLNESLPKLAELGIDLVAVSGDPEDRAKEQISKVNPDYAVGYDLSIDQMKTLGLYISNPRSPEETDRPFAEPGLFVVNADGDAQVIDISNAPFARPNIETLLMGLGFIKNPDNHYPVRGTYA